MRRRATRLSIRCGRTRGFTFSWCRTSSSSLRKRSHINRKTYSILTQMLHLARNLLQNETLFIEAYISPLIPSILTCLTGKNISSPSDSLNAVIEVRDMAASLIIGIARKHSKSSTTLKPRLARTLLKTFLNPSKSFGAHYGSLISLRGIIGVDGVKAIVLPNLQSLRRPAAGGPRGRDKAGRGRNGRHRAAAARRYLRAEHAADAD